MPNVEEETTENNNEGGNEQTITMRRNSENSTEVMKSGGSRSLLGRFRRGAYVFCLVLAKNITYTFITHFVNSNGFPSIGELLPEMKI